jgi:hypothetical protein
MYDRVEVYSEGYKAGVDACVRTLMGAATNVALPPICQVALRECAVGLKKLESHADEIIERLKREQEARRAD